MPSLRQILEKKQTEVIAISQDATSLEAAVLMNHHQIGALVVTDEQRRISGIITERDILRKVVATRSDPTDKRVSDIMTREVVCATPDTKITEARAVMTNRRIRHLPVVEEGSKLLGIVSIGDLNAFHNDAQEQTIHYLHEYLYGNT